MGFMEFEGKKEVRFGGSKKYVPDAGRYVCEVQDNIDTKYKEESGITSLIFDFKTVKALSGQDGTNLGISVRMWVPNGIEVAKRKLKSLIAFTGQAKFFEEKYEEIPNVDSEKWPEFIKDVRDRLSYRLVGVEIGNRLYQNKPVADVNAFFPNEEPKKVPVAAPTDFEWEG